MRLHAAGLLVLLAGTACATPRAAAPRATLPPDSLELLRQALERVRPGYATQADALRAGVYGGREAAVAARPEPAVAAPVPPPAPAAPPVREPPPQQNPSLPPAAPPPPAPAPAPPGIPAPDPDGRYVVQIAAFRDEASARLAAADAARSFPALVPLIEVADGWFRLALAGWAQEHDARGALPMLRELYPSAWVRGRGVP